MEISSDNKHYFKKKFRHISTVSTDQVRSTIFKDKFCVSNDQWDKIRALYRIEQMALPTYKEMIEQGQITKDKFILRSYRQSREIRKKIVPTIFNYLKDVIHFDLSSMDLDDLPKEILNLESLKILDLGSNPLRSCTKLVYYLNNLEVEELKINMNKLPEEVIDQFSDLQSIRKLNISTNRQVNGIFKLTHLNHLDINGNLTYLPNLENLRNLKYLRVYCDLTCIPEGFSELQKLTILELTSKNISSLPASLSTLKNLRHLRLNINLSQLPEYVTEFTELRYLGLTSSNLNSLPASISQLQNLEELRLGCRNLNSLPASISQLQNLKKLILVGSNLNSLPASIGQLSNLEFLHLRDNNLNSLPASIGQLSNLETLKLYENQLKNLPKTIENLANLKFLIIDAPITNLPSSIGTLTQLTELEITGHKMSTLPKTIGQLQSLEKLKIQGFEHYVDDGLSLELPEELGELINLRSLSLTFNNIQNLPQELLQLKNLVSFNVVLGNPFLETPLIESIDDEDQAVANFNLVENMMRNGVVVDVEYAVWGPDLRYET